jgi:peroxiredoxin
MYAPNTPKADRTWPIVENFMPEFTLLSAEGQPVRTLDYHRLRSLVLVFAGEYDASASFRLPAELAAHYPEIARQGAGVLAVVRGTPAEAARVKERQALPFPVLADEDARVHRTYGAVTPDGRTADKAAFVAGRFGKLYLSSRAGDGPPLPSAAGILGILRFIEARCPECGRDEPLV